MDPPPTVKTYRYNPSSQQPTFSFSETPLRYRSFPGNISAFKDASFSSYIRAKDPSRRSREYDVGDAVDDTEISIFGAQTYLRENSDPKDIHIQDQASHHNELSAAGLTSVSSADRFGRNLRTRSFHATPTASSEASWNSQTGLLSNPRGSFGVSMAQFRSDDHKKRSPAAKKWIFGRQSCCTGKKSVQVKEATSDSDRGGPVSASESNNNAKNQYFYTKRDSHHKAKEPAASMSQRSSLPSDIMEIQQHKIRAPNPLMLSSENNFPSTDAPLERRASASGRPFGDRALGGFSFPILNPSSQATKPALKGIVTKAIAGPLEDSPRDSLEVFQPMHELPSRTPSIDINPVFNARQHFNPGSPIARDDDLCSDASSDLFEIESFSTQTTSYPMNRRRDSLDEAPTFNARRLASANGLNLNNGCSNNQYDRKSLDEPPTPSVAAIECYPPSEVSIDWSVTTTEGFDKASVSNFSVSTSEIGSAALFREREESCGGGGGGGGGGKRKENGGGGLLMMSCRQEKAVSVGPQPVKCVAAEAPPNFPLHVGGRPPRSNKQPLVSSHLARLSLAFAA